jgi:predicted DCC family thiol-disulfide oxidoreductase YuxK
MTQPCQVYYDGLCQLCSREVNILRRWAPPGKLAFVDIADASFDAAAHGVDAQAVHRHMHVRDEAGRLRIGLDALIAMWRPVPWFRHLATIFSWPGFYQAGKLGYAVFAWVRPKLPRRRCVSGTCDVRS